MGWGSQSTGGPCPNPRLDRDANGLSGACDPTVVNPNGMSANGPYCGPENVNLDAPLASDQYAIGLRFYGRDGSATANALSHVNIYCDGQRVFSGGYDPIRGNAYPQLITQGQDSMGDMWKVALVTVEAAGSAISCSVVPTSSTTPDVARDGTPAFCVDDYSLNGAASQEYLTASEGSPASADALCFH
jgi:hypothetical protein